MKTLAILCLVLASTLPTAAAAETIADQAKQAYKLYAGGMSQQDYMSTRYGREIVTGVAGKWVKLNGPDPRTGIETYGNDTDKACKSPAAVTLTSDAFSITLTTNLPKDNFTQTYTLVAGATFAERTDTAAYLKLLGLGADKTGDAADQQRALILSAANGLVQIYRPSDEILVMTRERAYPIVFARCPAS